MKYQAILSLLVKLLSQLLDQFKSYKVIKILSSSTNLNAAITSIVHLRNAFIQCNWTIIIENGFIEISQMELHLVV